MDLNPTCFFCVSTYSGPVDDVPRATPFLYIFSMIESLYPRSSSGTTLLSVTLLSRIIPFLIFSYRCPLPQVQCTTSSDSETAPLPPVPLRVCLLWEFASFKNPVAVLPFLHTPSIRMKAHVNRTSRFQVRGFSCNTLDFDDPFFRGPGTPEVSSTDTEGYPLSFGVFLKSFCFYLRVMHFLLGS